MRNNCPQSQWCQGLGSRLARIDVISSSGIARQYICRPLNSSIAPSIYLVWWSVTSYSYCADWCTIQAHQGRENLSWHQSQVSRKRIPLHTSSCSVFFQFVAIALAHHYSARAQYGSGNYALIILNGAHLSVRGSCISVRYGSSFASTVQGCWCCVRLTAAGVAQLG